MPAGSERVRGLIVDCLATWSGRLESIGASVDTIKTQETPRAVLPPVSVNTSGSVPHAEARFRIHPFFSSASLSRVKQLDIYSGKYRVYGLRILHLDETTEILGQWDPSCPSSIATIYVHQTGPLESLSFLLIEGDSGTQLAYIRVNEPVKSCMNGEKLHRFVAAEMDKVFLTRRLHGISGHTNAPQFVC